MFGSHWEECPRCGREHEVGDVRGDVCMNCQMEERMRANGATEEEIQEAKNFSSLLTLESEMESIRNRRKR